MMKTMVDVTQSGSRLEKLRALAVVIAEQIDSGDESHSMAQLARQYRETIREIEEIEGRYEDGDDIDAIIDSRSAAGKPGAVR